MVKGLHLPWAQAGWCQSWEKHPEDRSQEMQKCPSFGHFWWCRLGLAWLRSQVAGVTLQPGVTGHLPCCWQGSGSQNVEEDSHDTLASMAPGSSSGAGGPLPPTSAKIMSLPDGLSTFHTSLLLKDPDLGWSSVETKSMVSAGGLPGAAQAPILPHSAPAQSASMCTCSPGLSKKLQQCF